jgi:hypothetical protein
LMLSSKLYRLLRARERARKRESESERERERARARENTEIFTETLFIINLYRKDLSCRRVRACAAILPGSSSPEKKIYRDRMRRTTRPAHLSPEAPAQVVAHAASSTLLLALPLYASTPFWSQCVIRIPFVMKFIIFATKKTKKDFSQGNSELIVSLELVAEGSGRRRWERRQGRFSNRMHSRGHDLGLTRCSAFPAEAASRSCLSLLLADLRGKLSFSFTSPF